MAQRHANDGADLVPAKEAAAILGVSTRTLARYVEARKVPFVTLPSGHRRFRRSELISAARSTDAA